MVHCYKNNGYNIVIDSNSGSVHVVDEVAFEVINKYETRSKEEIILELSAKYPEISADDVRDIFADIEELVALVLGISVGYQDLVDGHSVFVRHRLGVFDVVHEIEVHEAAVGDVANAERRVEDTRNRVGGTDLGRGASRRRSGTGGGGGGYG